MTPKGFITGFVRILVPTSFQALGSILLAATTLVLIHSQLLLVQLGVNKGMADVARSQGLHWSKVVLSWVSASAQITFWGFAVLAVYLLIWVIYNGVIASRTQFSPETQSVDPSIWVELLQELGVKALAGVGLVFYLAYFRIGLALWLTWAPAVLNSITVISVLQSVGALFGLAVQLYGTLALAQMTTLPWYSTEEPEYPQFSS